MLRKLALLSAAILALPQLAGAQSTTVVAANNQACVDQSYGDQSFIDFSYGVTAGFGTLAPNIANTCVANWGGGYGQLSTAFWSNGSNGSGPSSDVLQFTGVATDVSKWVWITSLDVGEWNRSSGSHQVQVYSLLGQLLWSQSQLRFEGNTKPTRNFAPNVGALGGLRVQVGEDTWYTGVNNLQWEVRDASSQVVPEPGTVVLLATGLVGLVAVRRRI